MTRRRIFLKFKSGLICLAVLCASAWLPATSAAVAHHKPTASSADTQVPWNPSQAPLPASLPSGEQPVSENLSATSCSSSNFCVAVGYVSDADDDIYPLVETYADGSWTAAVAPSPPDAVARLYGTLDSVSCPADGVCAAVGEYDNSIQGGLLENLSDGLWSATTAPIPGDPDDGVANLSSVSCADPTSCTAVGEWGDGTTIGLIYSWSGGTWQVEAIPPLPADYAGYITLTAISCATRAIAPWSGAMRTQLTTKVASF